VPAKKLLKVSRTGCLVAVKMADQADVAFRCGRLTDAIVLEVGLDGVMRARSDGMDEIVAALRMYLPVTETSCWGR